MAPQSHPAQTGDADRGARLALIAGARTLMERARILIAGVCKGRTVAAVSTLFVGAHVRRPFRYRPAHRKPARRSHAATVSRVEGIGVPAPFSTGRSGIRVSVPAPAEGEERCLRFGWWSSMCSMYVHAGLMEAMLDVPLKGVFLKSNAIQRQGFSIASSLFDAFYEALPRAFALRSLPKPVCGAIHLFAGQLHDGKKGFAGQACV